MGAGGGFRAAGAGAAGAAMAAPLFKGTFININ